jgi:PmbA protein
MERLLDIARKQADDVTVYAASDSDDSVGFENGKLKNADSGMSSGTALTVVKDGKQGFAYTRNLIDRDGLVRDAVAALAGGVESAGPLPKPAELPALDTAVAAHEGGNSVLVEECRRVVDYLSGRVKGQVNVMAGRAMSELRVLTSSGVDARARFSHYFAMASVLFPGTYAGIRLVHSAKAFEQFPEADLRFIADTYNASMTEAKARPGRTRVLFLPSAVYALAWRLTAATNAKSVYEKVSPLCGKVGERLLSEQLTLTDNALDDSLPGARAFDDEGTPCRDRALFDRGVLKGFYNDRFYARKTGTEPTGNGYRGNVTARPGPALEHLAMAPGERPLAELLKLMGSGLVVAGVLGAHSGNILNGDYSIGLAPGLWVEDGRIVGVVKDAMVAGNVYEDLKNVVAVGDTVQDAPMGRFPALLLDNVSFTTRG